MKKNVERKLGDIIHFDDSIKNLILPGNGKIGRI